MTEPTEPTPEQETVLQTWDARVRVLTNPSAWFGVSVSLGGGALVLGILFLFISKSPKGLLVAAAIFCGLMLLFVLIAGVIDLFGGFRVRFILTDQGVRSRTGAGAKAAAEAALVGGILTGSHAAIAVGTAARSEQDVFISWGEISRVKVSERRRYVLVKGSMLQKPVGLYCTADNFATVLGTLRERAKVSVG